jgi:rhomboid protease GluP
MRKLPAADFDGWEDFRERNRPEPVKEGQPEGKKQRIGPEKEMPAGTDKKQRGKNMFMEKTPVALAVLAACAVVFILINSGPDSGRISRAVKYGCYDRALIYEGQWWRMVTVGFTHIQPWHLAMNLYALYNMSSLERYFGHGWFALLLLGAVAGGSIAEYLFSGIRWSVGLSGGLYGLMAAYLVLVLSYHWSLRGILITIGINLVINFMPGIAWQAHLGGAVTGMLLTGLFLRLH